jgi:hypothetical protein
MEAGRRPPRMGCTTTVEGARSVAGCAEAGLRPPGETLLSYRTKAPLAQE